LKQIGHPPNHRVGYLGIWVFGYLGIWVFGYLQPRDE
jgi:hypothetical protein